MFVCAYIFVKRHRLKCCVKSISDLMSLFNEHPVLINARSLHVIYINAKNVHKLTCWLSTDKNVTLVLFHLSESIFFNNSGAV